MYAGFSLGGGVWMYYYLPETMNLSLEEVATLFRDRLSMRWPFHKERLLGTLGVFLGLGWLCVLLPTYHAVKLISEAA